MLSEGYLYREIAVEVGCSRSQVEKLAGALRGEIVLQARARADELSDGVRTRLDKLG
jgi:hypothetical protein